MPDTISRDEYQPRILGTRRSSNVPVTELVIIGKNQLDALRGLLDAFKKHKVELLGLESQIMPETKLFIITTFINMSHSDYRLEDLLAILRGLLSVDSAKGSSLAGSEHESFLFPIVALDGSRLVTSTTQTLSEVQKYFSTLPFEVGNLVMFATGRQSGLALVRSLRRSHRGELQEEMLRIATDELRTSGWGLFSFDASEMEAGVIKVFVNDPIIKGMTGETESWITYGISAGVVEGIYGLVGNINAARSYDSKKSQLKFRIIELKVGQSVDGLAR